MAILDYIFAGLAVVGLLIGLFKGFLNQLLGFATVIVIAVGTAKLYHYPASWFGTIVESQSVRTLIGLVITAIALGVVCMIVSKVLNKLLKKIKVMKTIDTILGMALGVGIVYAIFGILVALVKTPDDSLLAFLKDLLSDLFNNSWVVNNIYTPNNPIGEWIVNIIISGQLPI